MNRVCIAVATLGGLFAGGILVAGAASATPVASAQSCGAAGRGFARVAAMVARPEECCGGKILCARFLSTITLLHPEGGKHT